jgi:hypothetical protein
MGLVIMSKIIKQTGPKTKEGKEKSSQNAITHGVTSKRLINDQENQRYQVLVQELRQEYPQAGILIRIQIERLAHTYIQLERVQSVIDASYEKSRATSHLSQKLEKHLQLDIFEKLQLYPEIAVLLGHEINNDVIHHDLYYELLIYSLTHRNISRDDFLQEAPALAIYLHQQAEKSKQTINAYLQRLIDEKPTKANELRNQVQKILNSVGSHLGTIVNDEVRTAYEHVDKRLLKTFIAWYFESYADQMDTKRKLADYQRLSPIEEATAMPDFDELERLMRYQTTLQRQISTMMGELIALTR